ncbi:MAG: LptF/LptG family permease [Pirellulaceae bacterium]
MTRFDRYLLRFFVKVLIILFISISGLTMVIDVFSNFTEFAQYGKEGGGIGQVLLEYYGARILAFFDRTNALFCLLAAVFSIAWLQRTNEMTALLAAGIPEQRVAKPLVFASLAIALLAAANRELMLPNYRDKLSRNAQNWKGENPSPMKPCYDQRNHLLISGLNVVAAQQAIVQPTLRLHTRVGDFGRQVSAETARYLPADQNHPAGYLLIDVKQPANFAELETGKVGERPVLFSPRDQNWLEPTQCFLATDISFEHIGSGTTWAEYSSTSQLIAALRNSSIEFGPEVYVTIHKRFVQPLVDLTLLLLGLPLVLTRQHRNIFAVAGQCLLVVVAYFLVTLACQTLAANGYWLSPVQGAWFPLFVFVPLAIALNRPLPKSRLRPTPAMATA